MYVTLGVPCYSKDEVLKLQVTRQPKATDVRGPYCGILTRGRGSTANIPQYGSSKLV